MRLFILIAMLSCLPLSASQPMDLTDVDLFSKLHGKKAGAQVSLTGIEVDREVYTAKLEAFEVFHPDSKVYVQAGADSHILPMPNNTYYRGLLVDRYGSEVVLSVLADGTMRGFIFEPGRFWMLGGGPRSGGPLQGMMVVEVDERVTRKVVGPGCQTDSLPEIPLMVPNLPKPPRAKSLALRGSSYQATIAFDSDFEYYQIFGNTTDATDYIGDLVAYTSTVYSAQVNTSLLVGDVFLNTTSGDVWGEATRSCMLYEVGKYWNDNRAGVTRTTAHFLSGKNSDPGGIAWIGVLCRGAFDRDISGSGCSFGGTSNYGGAYGVSASVDGNFDIGSPSMVYDLLVFSHELGHNFASLHTHCYNGIGGNSEPIDKCYGLQNGCYNGPESLPSGCPGEGNGCGTIMSYCHTLNNNINDISFTLGLGHAFGDEPDRVAAVMSEHVQNRAMIDPDCLSVSSVTWEGLLEAWPTENVLVLVQNVHLAP